MLKDVTFGQYFPGDSVVHKMDPRMKLVLIIVYIVMLFVADGIIPLLLGVAVTVFAYAMSKLSFKLVWRSVKPILPIVVFTAILNIFFIEGDPLFQWKFITISGRCHGGAHVRSNNQPYCGKQPAYLYHNAHSVDGRP